MRPIAPESPVIAESYRVFPGKSADLQLTFELNGGLPFAVRWSAGLLLACVVALRLRRPGMAIRLRVLACTGVAVILFNMVLHTFFGEEPVLYSLHWHAASMLLAATLLLDTGWRPGAQAIAVIAVAFVVAAHNARLMSEVMAAIPQITHAGLAGIPRRR